MCARRVSPSTIRTYIAEIGQMSTVFSGCDPMFFLNTHPTRRLTAIIVSVGKNSRSSVLDDMRPPPLPSLPAPSRCVCVAGPIYLGVPALAGSPIARLRPS